MYFPCTYPNNFKLYLLKEHVPYSLEPLFLGVQKREAEFSSNALNNQSLFSHFGLFVVYGWFLKPFNFLSEVDYL